MTTHTDELPAFLSPEIGAARILRWVAVIALTFVALALSLLSTARETPAVGDERATFASLGVRLGHEHRYEAAIVSTSPLVVGAPQTWILQLTRAGGELEARARVTATTWAPETGEGSTMAPRVLDIGGGRYQIDDVHFPRAGWWNVALVIAGSAGSDSVAFNVIMASDSTRVASRR